MRKHLLKYAVFIAYIVTPSICAFAACPADGDKITIDDLGFKLHGAQGACSNDYTAEYELKVDQREILSDAIYTFSFTDGTEPKSYSASQLKVSGGIIEHTFSKPSCDQPNGYFTAKVTVNCNSKYYGSASIENVKVLLPPQAKFTAIQNICVGEDVTFNNQSIKGLDWDCNETFLSTWDFGDGQTSTATNPTHSYAKAGTYTVVLQVYTDKDIECTFDRAQLEITVVDLPVINTFSPSSVEICAGKKSEGVKVEGTNIAYVRWSGGSSAGLADERTSTLYKNIPSFTAKNNGTTTTTTTVTVTPYNSLGCEGVSKTFTIKVKPAPSINPITDKSACTGETISAIKFSSPISGTTFSWKSDKDVGFGTSGSGDISAFTATNSGNTPVTATVTVTATNSDEALKECGDVTETFKVTVNPIPAPTSITGTNPTQCGTANGKIVIAGLAPNVVYSVTLKTKMQYTADASGNITIGSLGPGAYSSIKVALGNCEYTHSQTITLTAPAAPETPVISVSETEICEGSSVTFSSNAADNVQYHWSGPSTSGWSSTEKSPVISNVNQNKHTGEYSLYVTKDGCNSGTATKSISIKKDPVVSMSTLGQACVGNSINMKNFVTYDWNVIPEADRHVTWTVTPESYEFTDNTSATSLYPVIKFKANTEYTIKVAATTIGCNGTKLEASNKISVLDGGFKLDVKADKNAGCVPFEVKITNSTDAKAEVNDYMWTTEPSGVTISNPKASAPTFTFNDPGNYKIKVAASNYCGPKDTIINVESHKNLSVSLKNVSGVCGTYTYNASDMMTLVGDEEDISAVEWKLDKDDGVTFKEGAKTDLRPVIHFSKSGTYNLTLTIKTYCGEQTATANIVIDEPIAEIKIDAVNALCANVKSEQGKNPYALKATPDGGTWKCATHSDWVSEANFYPNAPGDVYVKYVMVKGSCSAEDSVKITVNDYPAIDLGDDIAVCLNDVTPIKLTATPAGGVWSGEHVSKQGDDYVFTPPLQVGKWTLNYVGTEQTSGCKTEADKSAAVQGLPDPRFGPEHYCLPGETVFEPVAEAGNKFYYTYGDGDSDMTGRHTYAEIGTYEVKLVVEAGTGCKDSLTKNILIEQAPVPTFTLDKHDGCSDLPVLITPSVTTADPDVKYLWDFGSKGTSTILNPGTVIFTATAFDSTYTIKFSVDNICGSSSFSDTVRVYAKAGAAFDTEQKWFCSPVDVYFQNKTLGSMISVSYLWDFGDGSTSTERFPTHTFNSGFMEAKTYTVKLTATNKCGSDATTGTVSVKPQTVKAQFTNPSNYNCVNTEICFDNNSLGMCDTDPISRWTWDFGNGKISGEWDGCTTYADTGTYKIKLTINNNCGQDSYESEIHISPAPVLTLAAPNLICQWDTISPTFTSNEPLNSYTWSFGDGSTSQEKEPHHQYVTSGDYQVTISVKADNPGKCPADTTKYVHVQKEPDPYIIPLDTAGCSPFEYKPQIENGYFLKFDYEEDSTFVSLYEHSYYNYGITPLRYVTTIKIEDEYGCKSEKTGHISVYPQPIAKFTKYVSAQECPEEVTLLNYSEGADGCTWLLPYKGEVDSCGDQKEYFTSDIPREITLRVENFYKCTDEYTLVHQPLMKGLYFPNTFSPNGSLEEVRTFNGIGMGLKEYELDVYDMYGNLIYSTTSIDEEGKPDKGWDGRDAGGNILPQDVYTWRAKAVFIDGSEFPGGNSRNNTTIHRGSVFLMHK